MRVRISRRAIVALSAVVALVALAIVLGPSAQLVDLAKVERGDMLVTVDSDGHTRIKNIYSVPATIAGYMPRILFKPGDMVRKGDVLVTIRPPQSEFLASRERATQEARIRNAAAELEQAKASVEEARAKLAFAKVELVRANSLQASGVTARRTAELAELDVTTKSAELIVAEKTIIAREANLEMERAALMNPAHDIRIASNQSGAVDVTSPTSGVVLKIVQESETIVNKGAPLAEIGDPHDLEIMLEMLSVDAVKVKVGAPAEIVGWGGARTLHARVRLVEPLGFTKVSALGVEEQRVVVVLDFTDPPEIWRSLTHGSRIDAKITVWEGENVIKAPIGALFRLHNKWRTYVVENGAAKLRDVTIGHTNDDFAEIVGGLKQGDIVVLHPSDHIFDGARVEQRSS